MERFRVTAEVLNVREGPGRSFDVLTRILRGTVVRATGGAQGRWLPVTFDLVDGTVEGWVSSRFLAEDREVPQEAGPAWLEAARGEIGIEEFAGPEHNPRIVEYHQATSLRASADEVPWCSSFVNWCMRQAGEAGTGLANARSWLDWGHSIDEPRQGCVVVFSRGSNPAHGHVALFLRDRGAVLEVLGGNQSNQVNVSPYPRARLLGFRWPTP